MRPDSAAQQDQQSQRLSQLHARLAEVQGGTADAGAALAGVKPPRQSGAVLALRSTVAKAIRLGGARVAKPANRP